MWQKEKKKKLTRSNFFLLICHLTSLIRKRDKRNNYHRKKWNLWLEFNFRGDSISLRANALGKGMNLFLLFPAMNK